MDMYDVDDMDILHDDLVYWEKEATDAKGQLKFMVEANLLLTKELRTELETRRRGIQEYHEIEQILGKALGYPWFKDDKQNFPDATEEDGVCVGEHTAYTLATVAAGIIKDMRDRQLSG